eukprot:3108931-Prymnesium_polylepis.1
MDRGSAQRGRSMDGGRPDAATDEDERRWSCLFAPTHAFLKAAEAAVAACRLETRFSLVLKVVSQARLRPRHARVVGVTRGAGCRLAHHRRTRPSRSRLAPSRNLRPSRPSPRTVA